MADEISAPASDDPFFISAAESAPAGIGGVARALDPAGIQ